MQTAQAWFMGGTTDNDLQKPSSSLLSDWNSYGASRSVDDGGPSTLGFDLEAAVRTANDKVSGTLNLVSKNVREIPGSFQTATSSVPSGKALMYFGLFLASGVFFIFIAFTMFLPVMMLMPRNLQSVLLLAVVSLLDPFLLLKVLIINWHTCLQKSVFPSHSDFYAAWWGQSMYPWCFIATCSLFSFL